MTALRARRADLTATEAALKLRLQQAASQPLAAATSVAASGHHAQAHGPSWPHAVPQPADMGHRSGMDPWDSAGAQLRSAGDGNSEAQGSMQGRMDHLDAGAGRMRDYSDRQAGNGPPGAQYGENYGRGTSAGAQGSGAGQGSAGTVACSLLHRCPCIADHALGTPIIIESTIRDHNT